MTTPKEIIMKAGKRRTLIIATAIAAVAVVTTGTCPSSSAPCPGNEVVYLNDEGLFWQKPGRPF